MIIDKVQKYTKPFEHLVIDDFFTPEILQRISDLPDNNNRVQRIEDPDIFNYFEDNVGIDFIKQHLTYTRKDPAGNSYAEITRCSDPYMYGIHDEHHKKKVSTVVYLEPQYASGTFLYNEKKQLVKQVAWKPNRAFIFSGIPNVTWHDYGHWEPEPRVSTSYFIK